MANGDTRMGEVFGRLLLYDLHADLPAADYA